VDLDDMERSEQLVDESSGPDEALVKLEVEEPTVAQVVKLQLFRRARGRGGRPDLGISVRTANRHWAFARAWLFRQVPERRRGGISRLLFMALFAAHVALSTAEECVMDSKP
jgi:hypothetical protein